MRMLQIACAVLTLVIRALRPMLKGSGLADGRYCAALVLTVSTAAVGQQHPTHPPSGADQVPAEAGLSTSDPVLVRQIEQLRQRLRDLQMQMGATAPPGSGALAQPSAPVPAWNCPDCLTEMGIDDWMSGAAAEHGPLPLPQFPGTSHVYHLGATDFFLDHSQRAGFTVEQQARLARIREQALLARASAGREIEEADQRLFILTAAERPDVDRIEAQVRRIESLHVARRLAFIRAVGEAAQVLTNEQRQAVVGPTP